MNEERRKKVGDLDGDSYSSLRGAPDEITQARADRRAFSNPAERAMHLRLFFAWLPKLLHDEPGIE